MALIDKKVIFNDNPLDTIEKQLQFGFNLKEAKQNIEASERICYKHKDVKKAVLKLKKNLSGITMSNQLFNLIDKIFGDFEK
jgi:hypothetical protein